MNGLPDPEGTNLTDRMMRDKALLDDFVGYMASIGTIPPALPIGMDKLIAMFLLKKYAGRHEGNTSAGIKPCE